jgi:plastocyanin
MTCDKKVFWCFLLVAAFVFLCGDSTAETSRNSVVAITHSGFLPQNLTVTQGATVTWSNNDVNAYYQASHRVKTDQSVAGSVDFLSPRLEPGDTFSYVFDVPGNVGYHSASDPSMSGRVFVVPLVPTTTSLRTVTTIPMVSIASQALSNKSYNVYIVDRAFVPESLLVNPGAKVVWINNDGSSRYAVYHRIKSDLKAGDFSFLDSSALGLGDIYGYTFTVPGTYGYHCNMYPDMTGSIIVSSGSGATVNKATPTTMPIATLNRPTSEPGKAQFVLLKAGAFSPADITITRGTTVLWINNGPATYRIVSGQEMHAIGAKEPAEDSTEVELYSDRLAIGDVYSYTFDLPGTYSYREEQRPAMTGTVNVQ